MPLVPRAALRRVPVLATLLTVATWWAPSAPSAVTPDDGVWNELTAPFGRNEATAIHDPVRDRMIVFGGFNGSYRNEVFVLPLEAGEWSRLEVAGTPPPGRSQHTAIYDPVRDRMIVYGGTNGVTSLTDVWELVLSPVPTWSPIFPAGAPSTLPRARHIAIYDPVRDRMVVYGGASANAQTLVLTLSGSPQWSELDAVNSTVGMTGHSAIYDPLGDRMVVVTPSGGARILTLSGTPAWSALTTTGISPGSSQGRTAIYDAPRQRVVLFGGFGSTYTNAVHVLNLTGPPVWGTHIPVGTAPAGRSGHAAIFDPLRQEMIVYGGADGSRRFAEVWRLPLDPSPEWQGVSVAGAVSPQTTEHTMIYDPVRDRMLAFGGGLGNQVWAMSLDETPTWTVLATQGSVPIHAQHTAIYDPVRDRMIVFAGAQPTGFSNDAWALALTGTPTWSLIPATGTRPPPTYGHDAVYDPVRDRMIVIGGAASTPYSYALPLDGPPVWSIVATTPSGIQPTIATYDPVHDRILTRAYCDPACAHNLWELTLTGTPAWNPVPAAGRDPSGPSSDVCEDFYDSAVDRLVAFNGSSGELAGLALGEQPIGWEPVSSWGPFLSGRQSYASALDPVRRRLVFFGGMQSYGEQTSFNDVWTLELTTPSAWIPVAASAGGWSGRWAHSAVLDAARNRMIVFGGFDGLSYLDDLWTFSLDAPYSREPLLASGTAPSPRALHTAIYDPLRDRMIVFGGADELSRLGDVWELTLGALPQWTALAPSGTPPTGRMLHAAIYDPAGDRMVVVGGFSTGYSSEVLALNLSGTPTWEAITPGGLAPAGRGGHTAILDAPRNRIVVFGGQGATYYGDAWELSLGATPQWTALAPTGSPPTARTQHVAVYDATRERMIVFGGGRPPSATLYSDSWALSLAGAVAWSPLSSVDPSASARRQSRAVYDPAADRMVVTGGYDGAFVGDTWTLTFGGAGLGVDEPGAPQVAWLGAGFPNPVRDGVSIAFSLPVTGRISLRVFDTAGRKVQTLRDGALEAGRHVVRWDARTSTGERAAPGVYFYELRAGGQRLSKRVVLL